MLNAELKDKISFMNNERDKREQECDDELEKIRQTRKNNKKNLWMILLTSTSIIIRNRL